MVTHVVHRLLLLSLLGVGCCSWATAWADNETLNETHLSLSQWVQRSWSTSDRLPHNSVNKILQAPSGHLWLTTWEGPVRFNGRVFEVFDNPELLQVPDAGMYAMTLSPEGELYVGGARGAVSYFDGDAWHGISTESAFINDLLFDEQFLWLATSDQGVLRYFDGQFESFGIEAGLESLNVLSLYLTQAGDLYVGTSHGLMVWQNTNQRFLTVVGLPGSPVRDILESRSGALWVATDEGIFKGEKAAEIYEFALIPDTDSVTITELHEHTDGAIYFGTYELGLARIRQSSLEWLTRADGLPNNHVLAFYSDHEKSLWVSTHGGLVQLRSSAFYSFTERDGLPGEYIRAISEDLQGRIWVGTSEGIARSGIEGTENFEAPAHFNELSVLSLEHHAKSDTTYLGTYTDGLFVVSPTDRMQQYPTRTDFLVRK